MKPKHHIPGSGHPRHLNQSRLKSKPLRQLVRHFTCLFYLAAAAASHADQTDLVIYGSTPAAITAALEAKARGRSVVIVCPEDHIGGMTTNGLGWTDAGNTSAIGGRARDFYREVWKHYHIEDSWNQQSREQYRAMSHKPLINDDEQVMWTFEPHVAERIFERWLQDSKVKVIRNQWLDRKSGVTRDGGRIVSIRMLSGREFKGRIFMDATYEGDLMATAGVSFMTGREPNSRFNETLNGIQVGHAVSHQFNFPVDPHIKPGKPESGLLPSIEAEPPGKDGDGDHRLQAYCFRVCMSDSPENRVPFPKPENYDSQRYELLLRYFQAGWTDWSEIARKYDPLPNRKTDTNNHGAFSFDNIGMNYDYPEADYARRKEIIDEHRTYQQGLLWFMANDPQVPETVRNGIAPWGLAKDEFKDSGHWPRQLYIREARRMEGEFVMTERNVRRLDPTPQSVGMGSYNIDSHHVRRHVDAKGHVRNEGDIQVSPGGPYPISYQSIVPKREECTNLFVPVCLSATHAAYGSIRMEPVFMILGQSAAMAAHLALEKESTVQDVDYQELLALLREAGQRLGDP